jgi:hypothetical protein
VAGVSEHPFFAKGWVAAANACLHAAEEQLPDTPIDLRCLRAAPVECMILALKGGGVSGLEAVWDGRIWRVRRIWSWSPVWCICARKTLRWRRC